MVDIKLISKNQCVLKVDLSIYSDAVISKVLYWLVEDFLIFRKNISENTQEIVFELNNRDFDSNVFNTLKGKLSRDFIDYKNREIISCETKNIRDILYIKAFANNDEFEDYNLISE